MVMVVEEYVQLSLDIPQDQYDPMVAVLSEIGFYAFEETPSELKAFILAGDYNEGTFNQTVEHYFPELLVSKEVEYIPAKDWNLEWESNFHSVRVGDFCEVYPPHRAPDPTVRWHVQVAPKMAFGTGHHATTWLMLDACSRMDFAAKRVLDMGAGTGVLGMLAHKLGASHVTLIDIDPWSEENMRENAGLNHIEGLEIISGDSSAIPNEGGYEIVLANINRNVLMADRDRFVAAMNAGGKIALSGFYDFDAEKLLLHYSKAGLKLIERREREKWVFLLFEKITALDS
jgi:ribosomal protein L11 methyltransferase